MRAWLYDRLVSDVALQGVLGGESGIRTRVMPRRSQDTLPSSLGGERPFLIFGLGNSTAEALSDSTDPYQEDAERQFFQVWVHDEGSSFVRIDNIVEMVKRALIGGRDPASKLITVIYLETSSEFNNKTYDTIFRYIRFQAIIARGGTS